MIRRLWAWFWHGDLCPRCRDERTGVWFWNAKLDGELLCTTCHTVERIKFREFAARRFNP